MDNFEILQDELKTWMQDRADALKGKERSLDLQVNSFAGNLTTIHDLQVEMNILTAFYLTVSEKAREPALTP